MQKPRPGRALRLAPLAALVALGISGALAVAQAPAVALTTFDTPAPVTGNASWFAGLGAPYGGCGLPQDVLETQDFVALNVYDTPGNYTDFYPRPMDPSLASKMGMWDNGHNCGRWVRVTIGDYCTGTNDGAQNLPFCRNGAWKADKYNGATLDMIVADSCGDSNAWCRDDPNHLDLSRDSLNRFQQNGTAVGDMDPTSWNNRHISWQFIPAPDYSGDIQIGFLQGAQTYWTAVAVSHLPNGIHGIEYYADGAWSSATMDGDMGQAYIIKPLTAGGTEYSIRVSDVDDALINDGRVYSFSLPTSCGERCSTAYTKADYTTSDGSSTPTPTPTTTPTTPVDPSKTCTAEYTTTASWSAGFQGLVTVTAGSAGAKAWQVGWNLQSGQAIIGGWNAALTVDGSAVTAKNVGYNGTLAAGASTTFGFIGTGSTSSPTLTCTAS